MDTRYTVRQAMEMVGVKAYVLRYWEDELNLSIHRNEMGHRYYTGYDIQLFMNIKELKNRGLQLRAIRDLLPKLAQEGTGLPVQNGKVIALADKRPSGSDERDTQIEQDSVHQEKILEFQTILERLIAQELQAKNEEEERCRSLDRAIRAQQMVRREAAAAGGRKASRRQRHT
jgi:DNA-binding transcriptional MerR regulator